MNNKKGERWIRLLRGYSPVGDNESMQAEHVDSLASSLNIPKLSFVHPAKKKMLECFSRETGVFQNIVLTGTAGDGKTSLCIDLVLILTGEKNLGSDGITTINIPTSDGDKSLTLIFDVTAWRKKSHGVLHADQIEILSDLAQSVYGESNKFFVLAVNDGQMHELFRALPDTVSSDLKRLEKDLIKLHSTGAKDLGERLSLINLSFVPSDQIMELCLDAVLSRKEWDCLIEETDNPLFNKDSSIHRNFGALSRPEVQEKLIMLAKIADATGHHLPVRGVLCLIANAILGHPDAKDGVIRPGAEAALLLKQAEPYKAAIHKNLFGANLRPSARNKRGVYRFLSMLHIGEETTNDLDELFIFGTKDDELKANYLELISPDPFGQRNPQFDEMLRSYIRGDISNDEMTKRFLDELASERRRIFLQATIKQLEDHSLWKTTVFHYAGEYLKEVLAPLSLEKSVSRSQLRKLASGLNRIWTGLLLTENTSEIYFATGLDLSVSPVSDILLAQGDLNADPPAVQIIKNNVSGGPDLVLHVNGKIFSFALTLPRFEFLLRVSDGAMPSSFSKESSSDFMSLKQRCLRDLGLKAGSRTLNLIEVREPGVIHKHPIHLAEND